MLFRSINFISDAICKDVFKQYFCNGKIFKFPYFNHEGYNCYEAILIRTNILKGVITKDEDKIILKKDGIEGFNILKTVAIESSIELVQTRAFELLVKLYIERKNFYAKEIEEELLNGLKDIESMDIIKIKRTINLITEYIARYLYI